MKRCSFLNVMFFECLKFNYSINHVTIVEMSTRRIEKINDILGVVVKY